MKTTNLQDGCCWEIQLGDRKTLIPRTSNLEEDTVNQGSGELTSSIQDGDDSACFE